MPGPNPALALPLVHETEASGNARPRVLASVSLFIGFGIGLLVTSQVKSSMMNTDPTNLALPPLASSPYSQMASNSGLLTPSQGLRAPLAREQLQVEAKHYVREWRPKKSLALKKLHNSPTPDPFAPRPPEIIVIEQPPPGPPVEMGTGRFSKLVPKKIPGKGAPWKDRYDPTPVWDGTPPLTYGPGSGSAVGDPASGRVLPAWEGVQPEIKHKTWPASKKTPKAPPAEEPVVAAAEEPASSEAAA